MRYGWRSHGMCVPSGRGRSLEINGRPGALDGKRYRQHRGGRMGGLAMSSCRRLAFGLLVAATVRDPAHAAVCDGVSKTSNTTLRSTAVVTGLTGKPLYVTAPPGDTNRIFVVEQTGFIRIHKHGDPSTTTSLFIDLSAKLGQTTAFNEMGLLNLAFDPDYAMNGRFYVVYTEGPLFGPWYTVLARYNVSAGNPDQADPLSES